MSLIRAAGRDKDVDRAFKVLDDCSIQKLVGEMRQIRHLDVITYNTLIKGYCHAGVLRTAKACMEDMAGHGIKTKAWPSIAC